MRVYTQPFPEFMAATQADPAAKPAWPYGQVTYTSTANSITLRIANYTPLTNQIYPYIRVALALNHDRVDIDHEYDMNGNANGMTWTQSSTGGGDLTLVLHNLPASHNWFCTVEAFSSDEGG